MTIKKFENNLFELEVKTENGESLFNADTVARSLGLTTVATSGNEVVRWARVNKYLGNSYPQVGTGDFIPEPMVYKLAFKASNALAEKFQDWLAVEVLPAIRKTGSYQMPTNPRDQLKIMYQFQEDTAERVDDLEKDVEGLKNNQTLSPSEYGYVASRINQRVSEVSRSFGKVTRKQRGELFRDINGGIKKITGVGTRAQLRNRHYQIVMDYIQDWEPATATKTILRQMALELDDGE